MKEMRFFYVPDAQNQTELPPDEAMHAMRVLRLKGGDEMFLMDGIGHYCSHTPLLLSDPGMHAPGASVERTQASCRRPDKDNGPY